MDFLGNLNFVNPTLQPEGATEQQRRFLTSRHDRPTLIRDARVTDGVMPSPEDATELLTDGSGFLLVKSPSKVQDWTDINEVANIYYEEMRVLSQQLLPTAVVPATESHTYRNEQIQEHYWENGVQYGPCATGVHNDFADFVDEESGKTLKKFSEVLGMPQDKRIIGINIWRSVSPKPLARYPLAVCDRTSIEPSDLEYDLIPNAKPSPFNGHYCKPNEDQRWHYYSAMTSDEALVFTTYDSHPIDNEVFRPTLHTAVPIPDSEGLQERKSVEIRFFAQLPLPA